MKKIITTLVIMFASSTSIAEESPKNLANLQYLSEHSLAQVARGAFVIDMLDMQCPSNDPKGDPGNVATLSRRGNVAQAGCYRITREGQINIYWSDGNTRSVRKTDVNLTPYGQAQIVK